MCPESLFLQELQGSIDVGGAAFNECKSTRMTLYATQAVCVALTLKLAGRSRCGVPGCNPEIPTVGVL